MSRPRAAAADSSPSIEVRARCKVTGLDQCRSVGWPEGQGGQHRSRGDQGIESLDDMLGLAACQAQGGGGDTGQPDAFDCTERAADSAAAVTCASSAIGVATVGQDRGDQPVARRFLDAAMIIGGDAQPGPGLHECFVPLTRRQQCATQLPVGTGELNRNEASLCSATTARRSTRAAWI